MEQHEFDFLDNHSDEFITMAYDYSRFERLEHPDGYGKRTGECGDTVEMFLTIDDRECIQSVSIQIDGCINTVATANTVARLSEGKTVEDAWDITPEKVAGYLKTLEDDHFHCAELAVGAFCLALVNYKQQKGKTWKKNYFKS